jgi:hypothetical protein
MSAEEVSSSESARGNHCKFNALNEMSLAPISNPYASVVRSRFEALELTQINHHWQTRVRPTLTRSRAQPSAIDPSFSFIAIFEIRVAVAHKFRENVSKSCRTHHFFKRVSRDVRDGTRPKHFCP